MDSFFLYYSRVITNRLRSDFHNFQIDLVSMRSIQILDSKILDSKTPIQASFMNGGHNFHKIPFD